MGNKFQKSVLERLEQEAVRQKQKSGKEMEDRQIAEEKPIKINPPIKDTEKPENEPESKLAQEDNPNERRQDISDYLIREHQRLAKNKTFYLDGEVIDAIKSTARSQSVTDSKLVNDILRRVLGLQ